MGNMQSFNRATGLTTNSILDIFSMARTKVIEMLMAFCDDDDQISLKVCELKTNMSLLIKELLPNG